MLHDRDPEAVLRRITGLPSQDKRLLIALAGAPASGKSTLAETFARRLPNAAVVPMDGFHLDNAVLHRRGLADRKGAPDTFDVAGFGHLLQRMKTEDEVVYPLFERDIDRSVAGAAVIGPETRILVVEGNYLLLDAPRWRDLSELWDLSIFLATPIDVLRKRLMRRWLRYGFDRTHARKKTEKNDLPNARTVFEHLMPADIVLDDTDALGKWSKSS